MTDDSRNRILIHLLTAAKSGWVVFVAAALLAAVWALWYLSRFNLFRDDHCIVGLFLGFSLSIIGFIGSLVGSATGRRSCGLASHSLGVCLLSGGYLYVGFTPELGEGYRLGLPLALGTFLCGMATSAVQLLPMNSNVLAASLPLAILFLVFCVLAFS